MPLYGGGGGIPVRVDKKDGYEGVDAVIDKDFAACKLAKVIDADVLLILTAVSKVCIGFNTENEKEKDILLGCLDIFISISR